MRTHPRHDADRVRRLAGRRDTEPDCLLGEQHRSAADHVQRGRGQRERRSDGLRLALRGQHLGNVAALGSANVTATINASGLPGGGGDRVLKFTDTCSPANTYIRPIVLTVYNCTFDVNQNCTVLRLYLADYPHPVSTIPYAITNTVAGSLGYVVTEVTQAGAATDYTWLTLDHNAGTIGVGGADVVSASIDPTGVAAGTYNAYLRFESTGCLCRVSRASSRSPWSGRPDDREGLPR